MFKKVFLDVTNYCNSKCIYCFVDSKNVSDISVDEMQYVDIEKIIDDLVDIGVQELSIGGGEPFLKDLNRIFDYVDGRLKLSVTTNGTIINDNIIKNLAKNEVKITVSIDTLDPKISSLVRKNIDLGLVIGNIKKLLCNSVIKENLSLRTTVSKYNLNNLIEMIDFCNKNGVKKLKLNSVNKFGRAKENDITPSFEQFMNTLDFVINYCKLNNIQTTVSLPVEKYLKDSERRCSLGNESLYIDSGGNIYPCAFSEGKLCWGNALQKNIFDIITGVEWNHNNEVCETCTINRYKNYKSKTI